MVEVQPDPAAGVQIRWAAGILEVLGGPPPGAEVEQGARRACVQGRQAVARDAEPAGLHEIPEPLGPDA